MFFTIPILISIVLIILAILLILQPQNLNGCSIHQSQMRNEFRSSKHKFQKCESSSFYFCYLCHKLTNGWFSQILECKKCGIIIHKICKYLKLKKPQCKYIISKSNTGRFFHQWRQCVGMAGQDCWVCGTLAVGLESYVCIWCKRVKHSFCKEDNQVECDFGQMKKYVLEPTQIKCQDFGFTINAFQSLKKRYKKIKQRTSESQSQPDKGQGIIFDIKPNKRTVIVIINKKSGGQAGSQFIKQFYQLLNPLQVISILDQGLQKLKLFVNVPNLFFVIAGGDGTICSVLNYIKRIPEWSKINPPAAVLPLGTGNDLSRTLGWGGSMEEDSPSDLIKNYDALGKTEPLDRWKMTITNCSIDSNEQQFTVYNYIGIGLDAKICKSFHEMRQKHPELFFSQFSNKLIYTQMGIADILKGDKIPLSQLLTIKINDGEQIHIQGFENIILLNIFHWGGGVTNLWKNSDMNLKQSSSKFSQQSISDGKIQVIGLTDAIHMGQVQVGLDEAFQLAQCHKIQIIAKQANKIIPFQIDGEPIDMISPFRITIERKDQVYILGTEGSFNGKISKLLNQGLKQKIISQQQLIQLNKLANRMIERSN